MRGYIGLTQSLEQGVALWTGRQSLGLLADLLGPRGQPIAE
jgi:hypothetical protein